MRDLEEPGALGEGLGRGEICRLYGVKDLGLRLPRKRDEERRSHTDDQSLLFPMPHPGEKVEEAARAETSVGAPLSIQVVS